ncbi:MAG: lipid-A-disaccharide synthase N-terminal domain-containing protein [Candidatus Hydrogenedentales bacterium]
MAAVDSPTAVHIGWTLLGVVAAVIFYGRFYVQWIASELHKRSVMPIAFWYMSGVGSLMLLVYAVVTQSPLGALGQNMNIVIYSRNLVHIWRKKGRLSQRVDIALHVAVVAIALTALGFVAWTWYREYQHTEAATADVARVVWIWLAIGVAGQALFALRFLGQWIVTEIRRESVVPAVFWHLSLVAATLQCAAFVQREEWIFAAGMAATILIYARNIWFVHSRGADDAESLEQAS